MKNKRVLILGAAQHQMATLRAVKDMGCQVVAIDRNPQAPGRSLTDYFEAVDITDIDGSRRVAQKYGVQAVLPLSDFGVRTAAAVTEEMGLVGLKQQVALNATNKASMRRLWKQHAVSSPHFSVVTSLEEAFDAVERMNYWPLIFKPADSRGGGSRGVSRVDSIAAVPQALEFAQSFYEDKSVVVEEFVEGIEHSMETVVHKGEIHVLAISDKEKTPFPYRVDKSVIYPTALNDVQCQQTIDLARQAVKAIGIDVGAVHLELCTTKDGPKMFELGARFGGGHTPDPIVSFLTGINVVQEVTRILLGAEPGSLNTPETKGCVYRFITPKPGIFKTVSGIEEIQRLEGILDVGLWIKPGDEIKPVKTGADRSGYIVAGAQDREGALHIADYAEKLLRFDYL